MSAAAATADSHGSPDSANGGDELDVFSGSPSFDNSITPANMSGKKSTHISSGEHVHLHEGGEEEGIS